jgi:hypothetical protein
MKLEIRTVDELVTVIQVCAWAFVVFVVMMVFGGTVFSMLYSVIFVQQPIKSMAPIDQAFTKMLNDVMLLMTGSITTLIGMFAINKAAKAVAEKLAPTLGLTPTSAPIAPTPVSSTTMPSFNWMGYNNPTLDESWTPGPPPTTAHDHEHPEREEIAMERAIARSES